MGTTKLLAGAALVLAAAFAFAQDANPPAGQSSSQHHHHTQIAVEDTPAQPTELTAAEAAIEKKDYSSAEPLLRTLVERDPANYAGWFDLGFVENALGKVNDSIAAYRKSVGAKPDVFESNLNLGLQLAKTGQPDTEKYLRAATLLKPTAHMAEGQFRAWLALAQTVEKTRPEEAIVDYRRAAAFQPKEAEPHLSAGLLLEQENKFADAEQEYKQALVIDPGSVDAVTGLANIYMQGRRFPEAEDYLRKLLATHSDSGAVHVQLGRVLAAEGKTDAAIGELQLGIKLAPADDAAQHDLADLYLTAGKNELAEAAFRGLLASHPNDADVHYGLGKALLWQKKSADAQRELITAVKLKPGLGTAYYDLAFAANDNKDYPVIIRALDVRAKLELSETPMTYFLRASAYDHLRDFKNAAANFHLFLNVANGKFPNQEWQAKHRLIAIEPKK
jgi:tetratricopeptide (TPR) repeat protein